MTDLRSFASELDADQPGWRDKYQAWRQGGAKGAKGEHGDADKPLLRHHYSASDADKVAHDSDAFLTYWAKQINSSGDGQTNKEAIVNLLNNCLGVGILGVAYAISQTGVLAGFCIMLCSVSVNAYTLLLHQKACKMMACGSGGTELAEILLGSAGKLLMVVLLTVFGFFCMVAMLYGSTDAFEGLLSLFLDKDLVPSRPTIMKVCWLVLLVPPTFVRSMKNIAVLSAVAFVFCLLLVFSVLASCSLQFAIEGFPSVDDIKWMPDDFADLMKGLPTLLLIFAIQAGGAVVLATMENTETENHTKVTTQSFSIVFVLDVLVGMCVYLANLGDTPKDATTKMLLPPPFTVRTDLTVIALISQLVLLVLSYMLMAIPCKIATIQMVFGKQEERMESTPAEVYGTNSILNVLALVTGLAVSDMAVLFGINGAIFTNLLAFIMPTILYVKARANPRVEGIEPVRVASLSNLPFFVICLGGTIMLVLCSHDVLKDLM